MIIVKRCKLPLSKQKLLLNLFIAGCTARAAAPIVAVNRETAKLFFRKLRKRLYDYHISESRKLNGIVEIDECYTSSGYGGRKAAKQGRNLSGKIAIVGAQMYIDIKAPADIKAQAQGLFFFFYGIAQILGTFFSTWLIETNTVTLSVESVTATVDAVKQVAATGTAVDWKTIFLVESGISAVLLVAFMLFFKDDAKSAQ